MASINDLYLSDEEHKSAFDTGTRAAVRIIISYIQHQDSYFRQIMLAGLEDISKVKDDTDDPKMLQTSDVMIDSYRGLIPREDEESEPLFTVIKGGRDSGDKA